MKKMLSLIIVFVLLVSMAMSTFAAPTPFVTDPLTKEEQTTFTENSPVKKIEELDWTKPIESFDVNEDEMILVLFKRSSEYAICVYNSIFEFQYGFSFHSYGTVACEWSGNDIMVYFVRSDIYAKLDSNGQWTEFYRVPLSSENNRLINDLLDKETEISVNNTTYKAQNDMGILNIFQTFDGHYSQLTKIDKNNNETILYDINSLQTARTLLELIFTIGFAFAVLVVVFKPIIQERKKNKKN